MDKAPSAELRPGQTDQDDLPPYEVLDEVLERHLQDHCSADDLVAKGFAAPTVRVCGLIPAWRGTPISPQAAMKAGARGVSEGHSRFTMGKVLVVAQVALSLIVVACGCRAGRRGWLRQRRGCTARACTPTRDA